MKPIPLHKLGITLAGVLALIVSPANATTIVETFGTGGNAFTVPFLPIGNAGNGPDPATGYGSVSYNYNMSTYAISQAQLAAAVNQGAASAYGAPNLGGYWSGSQPAADLQLFQAAAFVNLLNTSQGYAPAYNLAYSGGNWSMALSANPFPLGGGLFDLYRNANAFYFLPTENEYYKAAYHANDGVTADYFLYATGSNAVPAAVASGTGAGAVVYNDLGTSPAAVDQSGGLSPYGTMGQSGNVYEWTEDSYSGGYNLTDLRALRGGFWGYLAGAPAALDTLRSTSRGYSVPSNAFSGIGFRVVSAIATPEPASALLLCFGFGLLASRRNRQARAGR